MTTFLIVLALHVAGFFWIWAQIKDADRRFDELERMYELPARDPEVRR